MKKITLTILFFLLLVPALASAHQPRLVTQNETLVTDPEISKAYYGELTGQPQVFKINSDKPFNLYVNILTPSSPVDNSDQTENLAQIPKIDFSAIIIKDGNMDNPITTLKGEGFPWTRFWEPFGRDWYWKGPEYKAQATAGNYEVKVWNNSNQGRYSLAIGEKESFTLAETINAVTVIPKLKRNFFNESPAGFILSIFGIGYLIVMFILAFIFGFIYRALMKKFAKGPHRLGYNIGKPDRLLRILLGLILLLWAIYTTWNPILLFFSGFVFFEAIFSWCGLYAALGKNTCPID